MSAVKDITGQRFGRLTVLHRFGTSSQGTATWQCLCDCGKECVVIGAAMRKGNTRSCGCLHDDKARDRRTTHGMSSTRLYRDHHASAACYNSETGKFQLNCNTFVQMIIMGRSVDDYVGTDGESYKPTITKAFDFGYYPEFKNRQLNYGLAKRDANGNITDYYGLTRPNKHGTLTEDWEAGNSSAFIDSYSYTSYYSENSKNLYYQQFNSFANANDLAFELFSMGCEIPFSELEIGDIVFNKGQGPEESVSSDFFHNEVCWRKIRHVALVYDIDYDGEITFIECTGGTPSIVKSKRTFNTVSDRVQAGNLIRNNVMCARLPIAWGFPSNVPAAITNIATP